MGRFRLSGYSERTAGILGNLENGSCAFTDRSKAVWLSSKCLGWGFIQSLNPDAVTTGRAAFINDRDVRLMDTFLYLKSTYLIINMVFEFICKISLHPIKNSIGLQGK